MSKRFRDIDNNFKSKSKRLDTALKRDIPAMIGEEHKNGFRRSFREQRFYDYGQKGWEKPERKDTGTAFPPPTKSHLTRDTLIGKAGAGGSGLQDSFRVSVRKNEVAIANTKDYAGIHNEGGIINVPVSKDMRKFAWAMYYKAKKRGAKNYESWKGLALTNKKSLKIKIPQRKFMGHSRKIDNEVDEEIDKELNKIL